MARILVTNFHKGPGTGHTTYIRTLTRLSGESEHVVGVAVAERSRLYRLLKEHGHPHLFACEFPNRVLKRKKDFLSSIRRFRDIVREFRPDIVHTNGGADLFVSLWSHPVARPYRVVRTHHANRKIRSDPYHRLVYGRLTSANIFVSDSAYEKAVSRGVVPHNALVIKNGVDVDRFRPMAKDDGLARRFGIDEGTFCFGTSGGTKFYKRVDTIIKAASLVKTQRRFAILVLGGPNPELEEMARALIPGKFVHLGFQEDVVPYISLFDVGFILSDAIETISFAAREMMSMGKPLISSTYSGLKENVIHGTNGLLVEPGDVRGIAEAMGAFLAMDEETLGRFSENARLHAVEHFNVRDQLLSHARLYDALARPGKPTRGLVGA